MHRTRGGLVRAIFVGVLLIGTAGSAWAAGEAEPQDAQDAEDAEDALDVCPICRTKEDIARSLGPLKIGGDFRFRSNYDSARLLQRKADNRRTLFRGRGRLWTRIKPFDDVRISTRLVYEPRYYCRPDRSEQFARNEALFDRLNVRWRKPFELPITARVGRQGIWLGEGWLVYEGTPLDGSRTAFFDAIRLTAASKAKKRKVELIWIANHGDSAKLIRPFNDDNRIFAEQDEHGAILHGSTHLSPETRLDGSFIYKRDGRRIRIRGSEGEIYTFSTLLRSQVHPRWDTYLEVAPQFGHKNGKSLRAFALIGWIDHELDDPVHSTIRLGYEYLSGSSDDDKNFDRLWGRYAGWNNVYTGTIDGLDGRLFDSSNLHRVTVGWRAKPTTRLSVEAFYHLLFADDRTASASRRGVSGDGSLRGQLLTSEARFEQNEHLTHRVSAELFFPGNYYADDRQAVASYLRYEIVLTW